MKKFKKITLIIVLNMILIIIPLYSALPAGKNSNDIKINIYENYRLFLALFEIIILNLVLVSWYHRKRIIVATSLLFLTANVFFSIWIQR